MGIVSGILGFISKPLDTVLKRVIKDKNLQMQLKQEIDLEILNASAEKSKMFEQRVIAEYEHPNVLRDSVRPLVTYYFTILYGIVKGIVVFYLTKVYVPVISALTKGTPEQVYQNLDKIRELMKEYVASVFTEYDFYIFLTILTFWFGGKLLERTIDKFAKTGGVKAAILGTWDSIKDTAKSKEDDHKEDV